MSHLACEVSSKSKLNTLNAIFKASIQKILVNVLLFILKIWLYTFCKTKVRHAAPMTAYTCNAMLNITNINYVIIRNQFTDS